MISISIKALPRSRAGQEPRHRTLISNPSHHYCPLLSSLKPMVHWRKWAKIQSQVFRKLATIFPGQPVPEHLQLRSPSLQTTTHEGVGEAYPLCEHITRPRPWAPGVSWHPPLHDILLDMSTGEECQSQANDGSHVEDGFIPIERFPFSSDFIPCLDL